jgi:ribosome-binding protein aMBF1 (putative translation factor)
MNAKSKSTTDAVEILHRRYYAGRPDRQAALEAERTHADVAHQLVKLRAKAGLTQQQVAKLIGTAPSVISRLEAADYEGHSLSMLRRIATALQARIQIRFVSIKDGPLQPA